MLAAVKNLLCPDHIQQPNSLNVRRDVPFMLQGHEYIAKRVNRRFVLFESEPSSHAEQKAFYRPRFMLLHPHVAQRFSKIEQWLNDPKINHHHLAAPKPTITITATQPQKPEILPYYGDIYRCENHEKFQTVKMTKESFRHGANTILCRMNSEMNVDEIIEAESYLNFIKICLRPCAKEVETACDALMLSYQRLSKDLSNKQEVKKQLQKDIETIAEHRPFIFFVLFERFNSKPSIGLNLTFSHTQNEVLNDTSQQDIEAAEGLTKEDFIHQQGKQKRLQKLARTSKVHQLKQTAEVSEWQISFNAEDLDKAFRIASCRLTESVFDKVHTSSSQYVTSHLPTESCCLTGKPFQEGENVIEIRLQGKWYPASTQVVLTRGLRADNVAKRGIGAATNPKVYGARLSPFDIRPYRPANIPNVSNRKISPLSWK
ncbi:hypothetical protein D5018_16730 [Parashewanella curva]|uniref:Uncharacterized protein n=1 Tax=Parashewanella curva TaxID=2338552 RepID=A0A3L8PUP2_9GAMM|nr:hypothetical protein [Parashewanella curva]RLV58539.1 hypothetical protein D5018_16730 [Parashewanella curva]